MKRFIVLLLCISLSAFCFARDVSVTGTGSTEQLARENAEDLLSASLVSHVEMSSFSYITDSSAGGYNQDMALARSRETSIELFAPVQGAVVREGRNSYSVELTLPQSSAPLYLDYLNRKAGEINSMFESLGQLEDCASVSYDQFDLLASLLDDYSTHRVVLMVLDASLTESLTPLEVTQSQVTAQRTSKRNLEANEVDRQIGALEYKEDLIGQLEASEEARLAELVARRAAMQVENENRVAALKAEYQAQLDEMKERFNTKSNFDYEKFYDKNSGGGDDELAQAVNALEARKDGVRTLSLVLRNTLSNTYNEMTSMGDDFRTEQMAMPYVGYEVAVNGSPTLEAMERRERLIDEHIEKNINPDFIDSAEKVTKDYAKQIARAMDSVIDMIEDVGKDEYTRNSLQDGLTVAITGYDTGTMEFIGYANILIGSQTVRFPFRISYKDWTGTRAPAEPKTMDEYYEYQNYIATAQTWNEALQANASLLFMMEIDFQVEPYFDSDSYSVFVDSYSITRLDTGKKIIKNKSVKMRFMPDVASRMPSSLLPPLTEQALAMSRYFDYDSIIEKALDRYDISKRGAVYSLAENSVSETINRVTEDTQKRRAFGSIIINNEIQIGGYASFGQRNVEKGISVGDSIPMGLVANDYLRFGRSGSSFGALAGAGVDIGFITTAFEEKYKNSEYAKNYGIEVRGRAGLGGYMLIGGNRRLSLIASGVVSYEPSSSYLGYGIEGSIAYGYIDDSSGGVLGLSVRYHFIEENSHTNSPLSYTVFMSALF